MSTQECNLELHTLSMQIKDPSAEDYLLFERRIQTIQI